MNQFVQRKTLVGVLVAVLMCIALLGIAAPQEAYADQGWNSDSKGWWYQYDGNSKHYYKNGWKKIDNDWGESEWYYFQKNGYAKRGWLKDGKYWYYLTEFDEGIEPFMASDGTYTIKNKAYYFDKSGRMKSGGWVKFSEYKDGDYYSVNWVYANKSGALAQGWKKISGKWYYFGWWDDDEKYAYSYYSSNGWKTIKGTRYYFNNSTAMVTGWQKIDGKWYCFAKSGAMQKNKWVGNYWLGSDGVMATDQWVDGDKYYVDKNGKWVKGKKK